MNFTTIKYEIKDKAALLTLNRPEKLNAWTPLMAEELAKAIEDSKTDKAIGAIELIPKRKFSFGFNYNNN